MATDQQLRNLAARSGGRPAVLKRAVVAGAGANTNIAVTGLKTNDLIFSVLRVVDPGATTTASVVDHTAQASIFSDGNLRVSVATNVNAGDRLVVDYYSV